MRQSLKCWYWNVTMTLPVKWESLNSVDFFSELSCWRKFSQRAMYLELIILIWLGTNWIMVVSLICFVYEPSPSSFSSFANSSDCFSSMCSISSISLSLRLSIFSISVRSQQMVIFLTMSWKRSFLSLGLFLIFFFSYYSSFYRYFLVPSLSSNFCNQFLILFSKILLSSSSWSQVASLISSYRLQMTAGTFWSMTEKSSSFTLSWRASILCSSWKFLKLMKQAMDMRVKAKFRMSNTWVSVFPLRLYPEEVMLQRSVLWDRFNLAQYSPKTLRQRLQRSNTINRINMYQVTIFMKLKQRDTPTGRF